LLFLFLFYFLIERDHLELSRREITKRGVPPLTVVEGLDVVEDGALQLTAGRPGAAADELLLQGGEERLRDGVVKAVPREPIETAMPASRAFWPKASETYCDPGRSGG
jgi:hypothetical protein